MKFKQFLAAFMVLAFAVSVGSFSVLTADVVVTIDGVPVVFSDQGPVIIDDRALVPVRDVFEALGFEVTWTERGQIVGLMGEPYSVLVTINAPNFRVFEGMFVGGTSHTLEVPAQLIEGRTMLPVRSILEAVGFNLAWDETLQTIAIFTGQAVEVIVDIPVSFPLAGTHNLTLLPIGADVSVRVAVDADGAFLATSTVNNINLVASGLFVERDGAFALVVPELNFSFPFDYNAATGQIIFDNAALNAVIASQQFVSLVESVLPGFLR